ncbi:hypothetical protein Lal_00040458 [Lupinus albus]|nr:hypothetical protein Lal_00040458 [Lupinus albus]
MTRGNTGHLHPINPEIDRTYHRLVRQSRNLPFHSLPDSVSDSDSISNSIPVSVYSVQYTDFVHSVALSDSEHSENSVYSENMAQPPTPPGPRERTLRELAAPDFTYDSLCIHDVCPSLLEPRTTDHPEAYAANIYNNRPNQKQQNYDPSSSRYNPWLEKSSKSQVQQVINNPPPVPSEPSLEELVRQMTMQNMQFQQETRASISETRIFYSESDHTNGQMATSLNTLQSQNSEQVTFSNCD